MSDDNKEKKVHGIVAEYTSVDTLLDACNRIREAGYEKTDAFTPFAVHGIDKALGIKPTALPWIVLGGGITGTVTALAMQIWMNAYSYPYIISGKPYISLPAFIPVAFALTILFASFGAFFGMWALNRLPKFSNPMFTDPRFDRVTDDRFVLFIDAKDKRYDQAGVEKLLAETDSQYIQSVFDDGSPDKIPKPFFITIALLGAFSIIPLLIVAKMRVTNSSTPRFHIFYDMDFSPAKDMQQSSTLFADGRAMRADVPGTVARGQIGEDLNFLTGINIDELARLDAPRAERLVRSHLNPQQDTAPKSDSEDKSDSDDKKDSEAKKDGETKDGETKDGETKPASEESKPAEKPKPVAEKPKPVAEKPKPAAETKPALAKPKPEAKPQEPTKVADEAAAEPAPVVDNTPWLTANPRTVDAELLGDGRRSFEIYCSVCHGMNGGGNGLVNRRAKKILSGTWIPPSSLHQELLYSSQYPDGKLFSTISNGIRKMPGYSGQITARDRWAIVAYVRALQRSQNATLDLVPEDQRAAITKLKAEIDKRLAKEAKAERDAEEERALEAAQEAT